MPALTLAPNLAQKFREEVGGATSVLIGTHMNPDGDALGSALAMSHYLTNEGIQNEVLCHHPAPAYLQFLPGVNRVRQAPQKGNHDLGIALDLDALSRLGAMETYFATVPRLVLIDHHVPIEAPGDLRIVETGAPATALILAKLFFELGATITPAMATCLLTGIVTDTGSFRFRNTNADALHVAAQLLELGGDINQVSEEVFQSKRLSSARLLGVLLENMVLLDNERIAYGWLDLDTFEKFDAKDEDTEGFVNELLAIETVQVAAILKQPKIGKIRISLRSRKGYDVAAVAQLFEGGGHRNAAGCVIEADMETAIHLLIPRLRECLESS